MRKALFGVVATTLLLVGGCSSNSTPTAPTAGGTASPFGSPVDMATSGDTQTAQAAAEAIQASVPTVERLIQITEDNDPNNLIGRPNGYIAATVLVDSQAECRTEPGVDCGAMVEQWPSESAAEKRSEYIQGILKEAPILGNEYNTVKGDLLLRVSGSLKPSEAEAYKEAFTG